MRASTCFSAIALAQVCGRALAADENAPNPKPVNVLAGAGLSVGGMLPLHLSSGWSIRCRRSRAPSSCCTDACAMRYDMSAHTAPSAASLTKER
ncbi:MULTISPECIES: hypothetical protein [unclassified Bradyrhizobium]